MAYFSTNFVRIANLAGMKDIPVHQLQDRVSTGFEIWHYRINDMPVKAENLGAHRDDHYLFFVVEDGHASLMVDFSEVKLKKSDLFYILPGQVHHRISAREADGWYVAIDTLLVPPDYREVFENQLVLQQPFPLNEAQKAQCISLLNLIQEKDQEVVDSPFSLPVTHSLLQAFLGMAACGYNCVNGATAALSRPAQISHEFKKLLVKNFITIKSPSAYAALLNVSESYLNEVLKKVTGFSVSAWIQQEVMLEAKRLLYYSQLNVKEITHRLGYDDPAYFSRIFKNATGTTPLAFRESYRK
jgi:AraC family transcriptional regulator, transcriptional activator of pobA